MTGWPAIESARRNLSSNAAVVRRACEGIGVADVATLSTLFDRRVRWHTPGQSSVAGNREGRDSVFTLFGRYRAETGGTFSSSLLNVLESDDGRVVAVHCNSAYRNGRRLDVLCCTVFELEAGRIVVGREHFYDLYTWDAFWT